jgi:ADP-dependent NAD(P)H-hydrate dehydratase / NAD(P)H-hydrate epimerase
VRLVTVEEMRALERRAMDAGTSEAQLMQNAGRAVADALAAWLPRTQGRTLLVLAGKGNNGGDALIAAERLVRRHGMTARIYLLADRANDPLLAWARDSEGDVPVEVHAAAALKTLRACLSEADVVLDGILGIGARLPLTGAIAEILAAVRAAGRAGQRRVAVDVPTGVDADSGRADEHAFRADLTLATGPAKPGLFVHPGAECAGRVQALDIGLGEDPAREGQLRRLDAATVAGLLPPRPDDSHKGTYGKVLVIGGSARYTGAAWLTAAAAVRSGAGLVTLAAVPAVAHAAAARAAEITFLPLVDDPAAPGQLTPGHLGPLLDTALQYDAVAVGPGLGSVPETRRLVLLLAERLAVQEKAPAVLCDADALNALAAEGNWPRPREARWVLTPHPGEMGRLTDTDAGRVQADRLPLAREYAEKWGQALVLKGAPSIIAAPDGRVSLNPFANAALASAGSGDVLSGVTAGLLAQGLSPYDAACAGSYVHALAAELWRAEHGASGLAAGELVDYVPAAQRTLRSLTMG